MQAGKCSHSGPRQQRLITWNKARSAGRGWGPARQDPAVEQDPERRETECWAEGLEPKRIPGRILPQCSSHRMAPRKVGEWPWCGLFILVITFHHHHGRDREHCPFHCYLFPLELVNGVGGYHVFMAGNTVVLQLERA